MSVLRLELYQETACYKKPFAFKVSETYPLPPYSTVKGMLHYALGATKLIPMKISIQGNYDSLIIDYQTHYFFKKSKINEFALTFDGLDKNIVYEDITTMPIYTHMLYDVKLIIHVDAEKQTLENIYDVLTKGTSHISLGRWEDIVRIDKCEFVEIKENDDPILLKNNAYIPEHQLNDVVHHPYKLNWTYGIVQGVRVWDKINVGYVQAGTYLDEEEDFMIDSYGDCLFFPN